MQDSALGFERSRWAAQLTPLLRVWQSLAPSLPQLTTMLPLPSDSPLDAFLTSEVAFADQLVTAVTTNISSLAELVLGSGVLTPETQVRPHHIWRHHKSACTACGRRGDCKLHVPYPTLAELANMPHQ